MAANVAGSGLVKPWAAGTQRYLDRELSWLDFNGRVLAMAEDPTVPLLERVKFLSIFSSNLDEFFMVRVASLMSRLVAGLGAAATEGLDPVEELRLIRAAVQHLLLRQSGVFAHELIPALREAGIGVSGWDVLTAGERAQLGRYFEQQVFPVLTPLAVDPGHPFPHISNLSLNLAVLVREPGTPVHRFARVKVPPSLPPLVRLDGEDDVQCRFVALDEVIAAHLPGLFPGMEIVAHHPFRVTRDADLAISDEDADDLLAAVEMELRRRRFGHAVRLEVQAGMPEEICDLLRAELEITTEAVYVSDCPLDLWRFGALHDLKRPDLKYPPWAPVTPARLAERNASPPDIFAVLREAPVLVHHPYDSFSASIEEFIVQASRDPDVLAIKQTLYRTSADSRIAQALIGAAERGKQVAVLIELTARFDEEANIGWARAMEQAGVHVVYGLIGLKTHSKTALVVRSEPDGIRRYCHVGTGNYNSQTARLYEDIGLLSADPELGADLSDLFNLLTGYSRVNEFRKILVGPHGLRKRLLTLIEEAAAEGDAGRIVMKMNSLVDEGMIDALYAASAAGCRIDLIVRGICRLRPETPGLSDRVRVRSVVGRYLEHSRIFAFGSGRRAPVRYYIGSADLMPRNLDGRVEVLTPVEDETLTARLREILDVNLSDDAQAWRLRPDGTWRKIEPGVGVGTNGRIQQLALQRP